MHKVVKILNSDSRSHDSEADTRKSKWCYVWHTAGSSCAFCTLEVFGPGEGDAQYQEKYVENGGITCPECLEKIKAIKNIKL